MINQRVRLGPIASEIWNAMETKEDFDELLEILCSIAAFSETHDKRAKQIRELLANASELHHFIQQRENELQSEMIYRELKHTRLFIAALGTTAYDQNTEVQKTIETQLEDLQSASFLPNYAKKHRRDVMNDIQVLIENQAVKETAPEKTRER